MDVEGEKTEQQQRQQRQQSVARPEESPSSFENETVRSQTAENGNEVMEPETADNQGGFSSEASSRSGCSSHSGHQHRKSRTRPRVHPSRHQHLYSGQRPLARAAGPGDFGKIMIGVRGAAGGRAELAAAATGSRRSSRRRRIARSEPWHFDLSQHSGGEQDGERRTRRNDPHHSHGRSDGVMPRDAGGGGGSGGIGEMTFRSVQAELAGEPGGRSPPRSRIGPRESR